MLPLTCIKYSLSANCGRIPVSNRLLNRLCADISKKGSPLLSALLHLWLLSTQFCKFLEKLLLPSGQPLRSLHYHLDDLISPATFLEMSCPTSASAGNPRTYPGKLSLVLQTSGVSVLLMSRTVPSVRPVNTPAAGIETRVSSATMTKSGCRIIPRSFIG